MGVNNIANKFKVNFSKNVVQYSDTELTRFAVILFEQYSSDLSLSFIQQIISFNPVLFQYLKEVSIAKEIA